MHCLYCYQELEDEFDVCECQEQSSIASDCSGVCDHCNMPRPAEDAFTEADWFPWWKKPVFMSDWEQLEIQALIFARSTTEIHAVAKATDMPLWFVEKVARNKYRARRTYFRIKRRVARMKRQSMASDSHR